MEISFISQPVKELSSSSDFSIRFFQHTAHYSTYSFNVSILVLILRSRQCPNSMWKLLITILGRSHVIFTSIGMFKLYSKTFHVATWFKKMCIFMVDESKIE